MSARRRSSALLAEVADFPTRRSKIVPMMIAGDWSGSMEHDAPDCEGTYMPKSEGVIRGLKALLEYIKSRNDLASDARISVASFGGLGVTSTAFLPATEVEVPDLKPAGGTPMCEALRRAASESVAYLNELNEQGATYSAVTIVVVSDGAPSDGDGVAEVRNLMDLADDGSVNLVGIGITPDDAARLKSMGFPETLCVARAKWTEVIKTGTLKARGGHSSLATDLA